MFYIFSFTEVLSTSSFDGLTITEGNKSGLIIGSTSARGMLADGKLVPKSQVPGTKTKNTDETLLRGHC